MIYTDRYHLTPEQSRFLAKKKWDENVYCGMKMENRAVTFPQTKTILQGVNVPGVQISDIQAILNMRDAWRFLIDTYFGRGKKRVCRACDGKTQRKSGAGITCSVHKLEIVLFFRLKQCTICFYIRIVH